MCRNLRKSRKQNDPEYEIKKSLVEYNRSEKMEVPAKIVGSSVPEAGYDMFSEIINEISLSFPELGMHLAGVLGLVKGASAEIIDTAIKEFQKSKRNKLYETISEYNGALTNDTIVKIEALPFVMEFARTLDLINRLANDKKLNFICNCFGTYFLKENHADDVDQYEEYLDHLSTLSYREIEILITLYQIENKYLSKNPDQQDDNSKNKLENVCGQSITELNKIALEKWNLNDEEILGILTSLCRSGFLRELNGAITGYKGGDFYTTYYFEKFLGYILPQDSLKE